VRDGSAPTEFYGRCLPATTQATRLTRGKSSVDPAPRPQGPDHDSILREMAIIRSITIPGGLVAHLTRPREPTEGASQATGLLNGVCLWPCTEVRVMGCSLRWLADVRGTRAPAIASRSPIVPTWGLCGRRSWTPRQNRVTGRRGRHNPRGRTRGVRNRTKAKTTVAGDWFTVDTVLLGRSFVFAGDQVTRRSTRSDSAKKITDRTPAGEGAAGPLTRILHGVGATDGRRIVFRSTPRRGRLTMVATGRSDTSGFACPHVAPGH